MSPIGMSRDELVTVLAGQPFDTDVQVNVGGFLIDLAGIQFDDRRHAIVIELCKDDADEVLSRRCRRAGCRTRTEPDSSSPVPGTRVAATHFEGCRFRRGRISVVDLQGRS